MSDGRRRRDYDSYYDDDERKDRGRDRERRGGGGSGGGSSGGGKRGGGGCAPRKPEIEILELKGELIRFVLSGVDTSFANTLRRVMIAEVPTLAIETVDIETNTSPLHDDYLAHRLGLVPLMSKDAFDTFQFPRDCPCGEPEGCDQCAVQFRIDETNMTPKPKDITTGQLHNVADGLGASVHPADSLQGAGAMARRKAGEDIDAESRILLVKLGPNQSFVANCVAVKGIGKEHAKWCPVAVATFQHDPRIELDSSLMDGLTDAQKEEFSQSCPTNVFSFNGRQVGVQDERACMYCRECTKKADQLEVPGLVTVSSKPERFVFSVEGTGALSPVAIVTQGLRVMADKFRAFGDEVTKLGVGGDNQRDAGRGDGGRGGGRHDGGMRYD